MIIGDCWGFKQYNRDKYDLKYILKIISSKIQFRVTVYDLLR